MYTLQRFIEHVGLSLPLTLITLFILSWLAKRYPWLNNWIGPTRQQRMLFSAVLIAAVLPIRELHDLKNHNNTYTKGVFDIISWWVGPASSVFGLYAYGRLKDDKSVR